MDIGSYNDIVAQVQFNNALSLFGIKGVNSPVPPEATSIDNLKRVMQIQEEIFSVFAKHNCSLGEAYTITSALSEAILLTACSGDIVIQDKDLE